MIACSISLFLACHTPEKVQTRSMNENHKAATFENIEKNRFLRKRILFQAYEELVEASSFLDASNAVTEESIWKFKLLFQSSAKIWNDLDPDVEQPEILDVNLYTDLIRLYMNKNGVPCTWKSYSLNEIMAMPEESFEPSIDRSDSSDDLYYYSLRTVKSNFCKLNKNNQAIYFDEPLEFPLVITFRISINNQRADIVSILQDQIIND